MDFLDKLSTVSIMEVRGQIYGCEHAAVSDVLIDRKAMSHARRLRHESGGAAHVYDLGGAKGHRGAKLARQDFSVTVIDHADVASDIVERNTELMAEGKSRLIFKQIKLRKLAPTDLDREDTVLVNLGRVNHFLDFDENRALFTTIAVALPGVPVALNFNKRTEDNIKFKTLLADTTGKHMHLHEDGAFTDMLGSLGYRTAFTEPNDQFLRMLVHAPGERPALTPRVKATATLTLL